MDVHELLAQASEQVDDGRYHEAGVLLDQALATAANENEPLAVGESLIDLAALLLNVGRRADAIRVAQLAVDAYNQLDEVEGQAAAHKVLGDAHSDAGDFDSAIADYRQALDLFAGNGDDGMRAVVTMELATVLSRIGAEADARAGYDDALAIFWARWEEAARDVATCQQNRGTTLRALGELDAARDAHQQARDIYEQLRLRREMADCDVNLANVLWDMAQLDEALRLNEQARDVYAALGLPTEVADCEDHIGGMLATQGRYEAAIPHHEQALAIYNEHDFNLDAAIAAHNLAHALHHLDRNEQAQAVLDRLDDAVGDRLALSQTAAAEGLGASIHAALGNTARSLELIENAKRRYLELGDDQQAALCDLGLAEALRNAGRAEEALSPARNAVAAAREGKNPVTVAEAEIELGLSLASAGRSADAHAHLSTARTLFLDLGLPLRADQVPDPADPSKPLPHNGTDGQPQA